MYENKTEEFIVFVIHVFQFQPHQNFKQPAYQIIIRNSPHATKESSPTSFVSYKRVTIEGIHNLYYW